MKLRRIQKIEEYILDNNTVSLDKLTTVFNVSKNTIRRDINELVEKGTIRKVYGGVSANSNSLVPFDTRQIKNIYSKSLIAEEAAKLVADGDIIFVDSGTTTLNLADFLKPKKNITVISNNLNFINKCVKYENLNVISTGGNLIRKANSFVGSDTIELLKKYNINKAFMASTGISINNGVTNSSMQEYEIKKLVVQKSHSVCILVDHSKFGVSSLMTYCSMDNVDYIVTDKKPENTYVEFIESSSAKLIIPSDDKYMSIQK